MSNFTDQQRADALQAGILGGVSYQIQSATAKGLIIVQVRTGTRTFLTRAFLDMYMIRKRSWL